MRLPKMLKILTAKWLQRFSEEIPLPRQEKYLSASRPLFIGYIASILLIFGLGLWSISTTISGAIIATGVVESKSNQQIIQHSSGGMVSAIHARDGDAVKAGDTLIELDATEIQADFISVNSRLSELEAKRYRLISERDERDTITYPVELLLIAEHDDDLSLQLRSQKRLFQAGRETFSKEVEQLVERISQLENQIAGLSSQIKSTVNQQGLITKELKRKQRLIARKLIASSVIADLKVKLNSLEGERGRLEAEIAQIKGQIISTNLEISRLKTKNQQTVISELRDLEPNIVELTQRRNKLRSGLNRLKITSPVSGIVHGSKVFALRSVIRAAEPIMYIVPQKEPMIINVRVNAVDRSQIEHGQEVALNFPSFSQKKITNIMGEVENISANTFAGEEGQGSYYSVQVIPRATELSKLEGKRLLPGMPVDAFLQTRKRTPLSFLISPLTDYFDRSFRGG